MFLEECCRILSGGGGLVWTDNDQNGAVDTLVADGAVTTGTVHQEMTVIRGSAKVIESTNDTTTTNSDGSVQGQIMALVRARCAALAEDAS